MKNKFTWVHFLFFFGLFLGGGGEEYSRIRCLALGAICNIDINI